jgi:hypothetical protein
MFSDIWGPFKNLRPDSFSTLYVCSGIPYVYILKGSDRIAGFLALNIKYSEKQNMVYQE